MRPPGAASEARIVRGISPQDGSSRRRRRSHADELNDARADCVLEALGQSPARKA